MGLSLEGMTADEFPEASMASSRNSLTDAIDIRIS